MDDFARDMYYMILGRDLVTEVGLNKKFKHVIKADDRPFIWYTAPMVDLGA